MSKVLVRVQNSFIGISKKNDQLCIKRVGDTTRNTIHFSVNGAVSSHEMGSWDDCGVVIICRPDEMEAPVSGVRLEDTWLHCGNNGLILGKSAIILAPSNMDIPTELRDKVIPYDSSDDILASRAKAIDKALDDFKVDQKYKIGRNGVVGMEMTQYLKEAESLKYLFNSRTSNVTTNIHMNSLDNAVEDCLKAIKSRITSIKTEGDLQIIDGITVSQSQKTMEFIDESLRNIDISQNSLNGYASDYFENLRSLVNNEKNALKEIMVELEEENKKPFKIKFSENNLSENMSYESVVEFINQNVKMNKPLDEIDVIDIRLNEGEKDRNLGSFSDVFSDEIRSAKRLITKDISSVVKNIENIRNSNSDQTNEFKNKV